MTKLKILRREGSNEPVSWDIMRYSHLLINAPTNSGKSYFIKYLSCLLQLHTKTQVAILDYKSGTDYWQWRAFDNVFLGDDIYKGLDIAYKIFEARRENPTPSSPEFIIADSGYKTPSIAKFLLEKEITPVFPYTRPRGKRGFLRPKDFVYDEHFDCYLCPENQVLTYRTTTREGYREYKSDPKICKTCPLLAICTESRQHQKVVVRHIWKDALEICEDIRHQSGMKERYQHRKETIERLFGTAKEYHNLRYTREKGKSKMEDKVGLTLACLNIKKLVKMMAGKTCYFTQITQYY